MGQGQLLYLLNTAGPLHNYTWRPEPYKEPAGAEDKEDATVVGSTDVSAL